MKILIKVTKEILRRSQGCQLRSDSCAISQAVQDVFPAARVISGHILTGLDYAIRLPTEAFEWYSDFDSCTDAEILELPEYSFSIEVPQEVIDKIGIGEVTRILSESKTLELVH